MQAIKQLPYSHFLAERLTATIPHLEKALVELKRDSHDDDGKARSLFNDLQFLHSQMVDRLRVETEKKAAEARV